MSSEGYEGFYERLSEFQRLEGDSIREWLKEWKRGESPQIGKQEEMEIRQIHLEQQAAQQGGQFKRDLDAENLDYSQGFENGRTVVDTSQGEIALEEISQVFQHPNGAVYVLGEDGRVKGTLR